MNLSDWVIIRKCAEWVWKKIKHIFIKDSLSQQIEDFSKLKAIEQTYSPDPKWSNDDRKFTSSAKKKLIRNAEK